MTRQTKTHYQRAEEALAVQERRVTRLTEKRDYLRSKLAAADRDRSEVIARRDYLAQSPDLAFGRGPTVDVPVHDEAQAYEEDA